MDNNTQLIITVISNKNVHYIINGVITISFVLGVTIGIFIQFLISKLSMGKLFNTFIYIISVLASIIAILQAFGEWDHISNMFRTIFK